MFYSWVGDREVCDTLLFSFNKKVSLEKIQKDGLSDQPITTHSDIRNIKHKTKIEVKDF